jgi:hypothetical protein
VRLDEVAVTPETERPFYLHVSNMRGGS